MRIDPRLYVLYLLSVACGVFLLEDFRWLGALALGQALALLSSRAPLRRLLRKLSKLALFGLFLLTCYALVSEDPEKDRWRKVDFGLFTASLNFYGIESALRMLLRLVSIVFASLLVRRIDPQALVMGMSKLGLPPLFSLSLDTVLALLGEGGPRGQGGGRGGGGGGGRGGGRGGGGGGGRGGGAPLEGPADAAETSIFRALLRGNFSFVDRIWQAQLRRVRQRELPGGGADEGMPARDREDATVIAAIALTMLGIKALKILPALPFAPGHKLVVLTPLYVLASLRTRSAFGATLAGSVMGIVAFLSGDGRYGVFEVAKHIVPGLLCDAFVPALSRRPRLLRSAWLWTLAGGVIALGRYATILSVVALLQAPAIAYAILVPGLSIHLGFGLASGYATHHVVRALQLNEDAESTPPRGVQDAETEGAESSRHEVV